MRPVRGAAGFADAGGLVRGSDAAPLVLAVLVVSALALLAGRRPRLAAALFFGCLAWFDHVDAAVGNSGISCCASWRSSWLWRRAAGRGPARRSGRCAFSRSR